MCTDIKTAETLGVTWRKFCTGSGSFILIGASSNSSGRRLPGQRGRLHLCVLHCASRRRRGHRSTTQFVCWKFDDWSYRTHRAVLLNWLALVKTVYKYRRSAILCYCNKPWQWRVGIIWRETHACVFAHILRLASVLYRASCDCNELMYSFAHVTVECSMTSPRLALRLPATRLI